MNDEQIREAEKTARKTESPEDISKLQALRSRNGLTSAEAEYMIEYVKICEDFVGKSYHEINEEIRKEGQEPTWEEYLKRNKRIKLGISKDFDPDYDPSDFDEEDEEGEPKPPAELEPGSARYRLKELNEKYKYLVGEGLLRKDVLGHRLTYPDNPDGWIVSSVC